MQGRNKGSLDAPKKNCKICSSMLPIMSSMMLPNTLSHMLSCLLSTMLYSTCTKLSHGCTQIAAKRFPPLGCFDLVVAAVLVGPAFFRGAVVAHPADEGRDDVVAAFGAPFFFACFECLHAALDASTRELKSSSLSYQPRLASLMVS